MNIYFLMLSLIITFVVTFFEDPDLIGINYLRICPAFALYLFLVISLLTLKVYFKFLLRQIHKKVGKWDNFNNYVEERLHLEQFESFE